MHTGNVIINYYGLSRDIWNLIPRLLSYSGPRAREERTPYSRGKVG